ncbi:MAG: coiled-coil domain-containing protein 60 [Actinomycetota bacterium]|nr:coiled-coil domain-containing protein 60 [Actinomycetota bacterium]
MAVLGAVVSALAVPAVASANATNIETGRAFDITTSVLGAKLTIGPDTGLISTPNSSSTSLNAGSASSPLISGSLLSASVKTTANESAQSKATIAQTTITLPAFPVITGKLITAESSASCRAHGTVLGSSMVGSLTVNGTTYPIASPPNTKIPFGLGTIIINEQIKSGNTLKVNAVHVEVPLLGIDVVVASAFSGVANCA